MIETARYRFAEIMRRHFRTEDALLNDAELVAAVMARYEKARREPIIDPNE